MSVDIPPEPPGGSAVRFTRAPSGPRRRTCLALAFVVGGLSISATANANPRRLPFTYHPPTLPSGHFEVEQYVDMTPVRVAREEDDGTEAVTSVRSELQTEFEYGITDWMEAGFYIVFRQGGSAQTPFLRFQGIKERVRFHLTKDANWPIEIGTYFEMAQYHDEIEFEEKLLLSRRFGPVTIAANFWVEQEYYFQDNDEKFIFNPTAGVNLDITPNFIVGAEYWARGRFDEVDETVSAPEDFLPEVGEGDTKQYLGPTVTLTRDPIFFTAGAYARLDNFGSEARVGDAFGNLWVRTLLGIDL